MRKLKDLFKKKKVQDDSELEFTNSSTANFEEGSFNDDDFKRAEPLNINNSDSDDSIITEDIERPITLNTNLTPNENIGKIEELSENDMISLYGDKNITPEEKLEEMFEDEEIINKDLNEIPSLSLTENGGGSSKFSKKKMAFKNKIILFGASLGIGISCLVASSALEEHAKETEYEAVKSTFNMLVKTKGLSSSFKGVLLGEKSAFDTIFKDWEGSSSDLVSLSKSLQELNNNSLNQQLIKVEEQIKILNESINFMKKINDFSIDNEKYKQELSKFNQEATAVINEFVSSYTKNKASNEEMALLFKLKESMLEMQTHASGLLSNTNIASNVGAFNSDKETIKKLILILAEGDKNNGIRPVFPETILNYNALATQWNNIVPTLDIISKASDDYTKIDAYKTKTEESIRVISDGLVEMSNIYDGYTHQYIEYIYIVFYLGLLLILASIIGIGLSYKQEVLKREKELIDDANRNKESILKLLNEMSYLQNGDLTKKTTIEEGITINIADSINATIDSLAVIVRKIQNSSSTMKNKTREIEQASEGLLYSTENQSNSILEIKESIANMSKSISDISEKTKLIKSTSENASEVSMSSMTNVQTSIEAMENINLNMNETVALMNNMVQSSKEISEVIDLLSDITEETNILALNASVQAAKAGEDGKGFKIVADAIHELANNAATATKKVSLLIATVQSDIKSVERSLEKTTAGVASGVKLTESVGESLVKIADVSILLNDTIKKVAEDVKNNASLAYQISSSMEAISTVTEETRQSARNTTKAISEIESISTELSSSVKSFIC